MESKRAQISSIDFLDIVKFGSIIFAIITAVILLSDWIYLINFYKVFGVIHLAYSSYLTDPVHISGIITLWAALLFISIYGLSTALLINAFVKPNLTKVSKKYHVPIILLLIILVYIFLKLDLEKLDLLKLSAETIIVLPIFPIIPVLVLLWFFTENHVEDNGVKRTISLGILLASVNLFFIYFIVNFSATAGKADAKEVLDGNTNLPIVAIVTTDKIIFSEKTTAINISEGRWLYGSQFTKHPETGNNIATIQYLGSDEMNIYLLDMWGSSVHAISKDIIIQVIYQNYSFDTLIDSGVSNHYNYGGTPHPN